LGISDNSHIFAFIFWQGGDGAAYTQTPDTRRLCTVGLLCIMRWKHATGRPKHRRVRWAQQLLHIHWR